MGVKNAYFPIFITEESLNTEKDHVEGFAAEVSSATTAALLPPSRADYSVLFLLMQKSM